MKPALLAIDQPRRHHHYWYPEGDIVIRVQNTLFKLSLSILHATKSPILMTIAPPSLKASKLCLLSGYNEAHPFVLQNTSEYDFVRLLWVLFPSHSYPLTDASVDDWVSILKLATQYEIDYIRNLAMERLHASKIDPFRKILLWREYKLDLERLVPSYVVLCQREQPLTFDIAAAITLEKFVKLVAAREAYRRRIGCEHCATRSDAEKHAMAEEQVIKQLFTKLTRPPQGRKKDRILPVNRR